MDTLTLQIWSEGHWHDACLLTFPEPDNGVAGAIEMEYLSEYGITHFDKSDYRACSFRYPVIFSGTYDKRNWFSFIDDIMPAGAARRYWVRNLGIEREPRGVQDFALFSKGTIAPIGNLRIKEALPYSETGEKIPTQYFDIMDELIAMGKKLTSLKEQLREVGVPESILNFPALRFDYLDKKLDEWGLL